MRWLYIFISSHIAGPLPPLRWFEIFSKCGCRGMPKKNEQFSMEMIVIQWSASRRWDTPPKFMVLFSVAYLPLISIDHWRIFPDLPHLQLISGGNGGKWWEMVPSPAGPDGHEFRQRWDQRWDCFRPGARMRQEWNLPNGLSMAMGCHGGIPIAGWFHDGLFHGKSHQAKWTKWMMTGGSCYRRP